ncbi:MAG TPA: lipid A export permease/ATP-binding protein MsbA [Gammaproteobacteria bacterium]
MSPRLTTGVIRVYRRLLAYVRPYRWILVPCVLATALHAALTGTVPFFLEWITEQLTSPTPTTQDPYRIPILIAVVFALRGATDFLLVYGLSWVGRSVIRDLRSELFGHYLALPAKFYDRSSTGDLISRLTYNTEQVAEAISNAIVTLVRDSLHIIVLLGVMIHYSGTLTLIVCVVGPIIGLLVGSMSRAFRRYSVRIQSSMSDATRVLEQSLQGHRIVKIFEGQPHEQTQFDEINARNFRFIQRLVATRALGDSLTQYVVALGIAAIVLIVFADSMLEELTAPVFIAFITAMGQMLPPIKRLININVVLQRGVAAADNVFATLDEPREADEGTATMERAAGHVEYRGVSFSYAESRTPALIDVTLSAPAGSTIALVGRSGSGKSTLVALLPRIYDGFEGEILLDGVDIRTLKLKDLRRQLSFVSQDVVLFDDTIAGNIAYGALKRYSRAEVERAAETAHVTEFARELVQGLDTRVGERGLLLSGGQRQRVAIARALLKDAPVLILDEATSALDTESERVIKDALGRLMTGRTTLVIAHRLSTVVNADRIVAIKDGRIVETGTHEELLRQDGYYSTLYRMQFAE